MAGTVYPTSVRLPPRLRRLLRAEARKQGRTFVHHITWILRQHFEAQGIDVDNPPKEQHGPRKRRRRKREAEDSDAGSEDGVDHDDDQRS